MNSLVVFLSVVAFVAGKPSGLLHEGGIIAYSSPIIAAAPSAVSHQSRLDIKSSPAVVSTSLIGAPIVRTIITEPAVVAAPAIATAAIAPAAVSSQSRIDIKTTPAITSTVVSSPVAYSAPIAYNANLAYNAPILAGAIDPTLWNTAYAAPGLIKTTALATGLAVPALTSSSIIVPSKISGAAVPLDTPEVIAARAAHFEAKALAGAHLIKKRSASLIATPLLSTNLASPVISTYAASPVLSTVHGTPLAYSSPIALSSPFITKTYSVHPW